MRERLLTAVGTFGPAVARVSQDNDGRQPLQRVNPCKLTVLFARCAKFISIEICPKENITYLFDSLPQVPFYSVTWHRSGDHILEDPTRIPALTLADALLRRGHNVLLHLSCWNLLHFEGLTILDRAKAIGVRNLFIVRGDSTDHQASRNHFTDVVALVRFIKMHYGDYFCIGVAAYPAGHPKSDSTCQEWHNLMEKVGQDCEVINIGADFVITQLLFNANILREFLARWRAYRITIPIIPGLYIIDNIKSLNAMMRLCHVRLPSTIAEIVERIKHDPIALRAYGVHQAAMLIRQLLTIRPSRNIPGVHLFTINKIDNLCTVLQTIGFYHIAPTDAGSRLLRYVIRA